MGRVLPMREAKHPYRHSRQGWAHRV